jgi:hypothetical protein
MAHPFTLEKPETTKGHLAVETGCSTRLSCGPEMFDRARPPDDPAGARPARRPIAGRDRAAPGPSGPAPFLVLTGLAPGRLCAQWDVTGPPRDQDGRLALRLYRLDTGDRHPPGVLLFVDDPAGLRAIDAREGVFVAEIGMLQPDGWLERLAASAPAPVPAAAESADLGLLIIDVRAPPPEPHPTPPGARFLRLFSRGRHARRIRRPLDAYPSAAMPAPPDTGTFAVAADPPSDPPTASGAHSTEADTGWPLALRSIPDAGRSAFDVRCSAFDVPHPSPAS